MNRPLGYLDSNETEKSNFNDFIDSPIMTPMIESTESPYGIKLEINTKETDIYELIIKMSLHYGAHYVSPNSKEYYKGIFTVNIDDNDNKLKHIGNLIENPLSVEEFDSHVFVNGYINWVKENTTYTKKIQQQSNDDFEVMGSIKFVIEPCCTLETIPFVIKYKNGKMSFKVFGC